MLSASRAKAKAKAQVKETAILADRRDTTRENAPTSQKEKARARDFKDSVTIAARKGIQHRSARNARKEESRKDKGKGEG